MDEIKNLESLENLGPVLPSPLYIAGDVLFGIVSIVVFKSTNDNATPVLLGPR